MDQGKVVLDRRGERDLTASDTVTMIGLADGEDLSGAERHLRRAGHLGGARRVECCGSVAECPGPTSCRSWSAHGYRVESVDGHRQLEEVFLSLVGGPSRREGDDADGRLSVRRDRRVDLVPAAGRDRPAARGGGGPRASSESSSLLPLILLLAFWLGQDETDTGQRGFVDLAQESGANLVVFTLFASTSFLLIVIVALFAGDTVPSEASWSSLRYLLAAPVRRERLLRQKLIVAALSSMVALLFLPAWTLLVGGIAYGWGTCVGPTGEQLGWPTSAGD